MLEQYITDSFNSRLGLILKEDKKKNKTYDEAKAVISKALSLIPLSILEYLARAGVELLDSKKRQLLGISASYLTNDTWINAKTPGGKTAFCPSEKIIIERGVEDYNTLPGNDMYDDKCSFFTLMECFSADKGPEFLMKRLKDLLDGRDVSEKNIIPVTVSVPMKEEVLHFVRTASGLNSKDFGKAYEKWDAEESNKWKEILIGKDYSRLENFVFYVIPIGDIHGKFTACIMIPTLAHIHNEIIKDIFNGARKCIDKIIEYDANEYRNRYEATLRNSLIKTAVSSIMARNGSHNDSHSDGPLSHDDRKAFTLGDNQPYLGAFLHISDFMEEKYNNSFLTNQTTEDERNYTLISQYIRSKMRTQAFQSCVSFGDPGMLVSCKMRNILEEFDKDRLKLNHISGLEGNFKYRLDFTFPKKSDGKVVNKDIEVAIPNSNIGFEALFIIFKNIIRNTAKHSTRKNASTDVTTFRCDINNAVDSFPEKDLISEERHKGEENLKDVSHTLYRVDIYDDHKLEEEEAKEIVKIANQNIDKSFVGENGQVRTTALGTAEMKFVAGYLRQKDALYCNDVDLPSNSLNNTREKQSLLEAYAHFIEEKDGKKYYSLAYRFYLLKPKEAMVVSNKPSPKDCDSYGIDWLTPDEFKELLKNGNNINHSFLVLEDGLDISKFDKSRLPLRILSIDQIENVEASRIANTCWEKWEDIHLDSGEWGIKAIGTSPNNNGSDYALFCNHGTYFSNASNGLKYAEALSTAAQGILPVKFGYLSKSDDEKFGYGKSFTAKILESVNTKVLVLDERFQNAADNMEVYGLPLRRHYELCSITIPKEEDAQLNVEDLDKEKILGFVDKELESCTFDFIVLHYGILERLYGSGIKCAEEVLRKWAEKSTIVITSGRGIPKGMPDFVRFVPFAPLSTSMVDYKSKYLLNNLLYSSRKEIDNG